MAEVLAKFIFLGQQLEAGALRSLPRVQDHVAIANKHCPRYLPLHLSNKTNRARAQVKCSGVTTEIYVVNAHRFAPQTQITQLLIRRIGVGNHWSSRFNGLDGKRKRGQTHQYEQTNAARSRHTTSLGGKENAANYVGILGGKENAANYVGISGKSKSCVADCALPSRIV